MEGGRSQDFESVLDFDVELCGDLNIESAIQFVVVVARDLWLLSTFGR